jgi:hypothetical protein
MASGHCAQSLHGSIWCRYSCCDNYRRGVRVTDDEKELLLADRRSLIDAIFQLTKWLIATLFLLNGSAALATLSRPALDPIISAAVTMFFINGLMSSLIAATALLAGLGFSYIRIMHMFKAWPRPVFIGIICVQLVAGIVTFGSMASSTSSFVRGVTALANVSLEDAKHRLTPTPRSTSSAPPVASKKPEGAKLPPATGAARNTKEGSAAMAQSGK